MGDNVVLAKQFNDEVKKLVEYCIDKLGESKDRKTLLSKLKVVTITKPFIVFDLWCQYVFPYEKHIRDRNEEAWSYAETRNNEMFRSFGVCDHWDIMDDVDKERIWEILERINKICLAIYRKRRSYGAMDAVSVLMENLIGNK
jgi:hypothetical protein